MSSQDQKEFLINFLSQVSEASDYIQSRDEGKLINRFFKGLSKANKNFDCYNLIKEDNILTFNVNLKFVELLKNSLPEESRINFIKSFITNCGSSLADKKCRVIVNASGESFNINLDGHFNYELFNVFLSFLELPQLGSNDEIKLVVSDHGEKKLKCTLIVKE